MYPLVLCFQVSSERRSRVSGIGREGRDTYQVFRCRLVAMLCYFWLGMILVYVRIRYLVVGGGEGMLRNTGNGCQVRTSHCADRDRRRKVHDAGNLHQPEDKSGKHERVDPRWLCPSLPQSADTAQTSHAFNDANKSSTPNHASQMRNKTLPRCKLPIFYLCSIIFTTSLRLARVRPSCFRDSETLADTRRIGSPSLAVGDRRAAASLHRRWGSLGRCCRLDL